VQPTASGLPAREWAARAAHSRRDSPLAGISSAHGERGRAAAAGDYTAELYRAKAVLGFQGYARHDELALLMLHPGRDDPYPHYESLRARGPLVRSRLGPWVTTSHRVCNRILRDRQFGVVLDGADRPGAGGLSFLEMTRPITPAAPAGRAGVQPQADRRLHRAHRRRPSSSSWTSSRDTAGSISCRGSPPRCRSR